MPPSSILQFLPGLKVLLSYRREDWPYNLRAGLTDAATAALILSAIGPHLTLSILLAMMVGNLYRRKPASSRRHRRLPLPPILIGFLHGIAIDIIVGQVPTLGTAVGHYQKRNSLPLNI